MCICMHTVKCRYHISIRMKICGCVDCLYVRMCIYIRRYLSIISIWFTQSVDQFQTISITSVNFNHTLSSLSIEDEGCVCLHTHCTKMHVNGAHMRTSHCFVGKLTLTISTTVVCTDISISQYFQLL